MSGRTSNVLPVCPNKLPNPVFRPKPLKNPSFPLVLPKNGNSCRPPASGKIILPLGFFILPKRKLILPNGKPSLPHGNRTLPNGFLRVLNGKPVLPHGKRALPNGSGTLPHGKFAPPNGFFGSSLFSVERRPAK